MNEVPLLAQFFLIEESGFPTKLPTTLPTHSAKFSELSSLTTHTQSQSTCVLSTNGSLLFQSIAGNSNTPTLQQWSSDQHEAAANAPPEAPPEGRPPPKSPKRHRLPPERRHAPKLKSPTPKRRHHPRSASRGHPSKEPVQAKRRRHLP